jgi:glycosyltransferase involved in cell wall biosynthesis
MQDYGLVSIITPNWNCAKFVRDTIKSVQNQTYTNWEMIIVDDCSTDESETIIKSFLIEDNRIKFIRNEKNSGAAISRNYALREAKGKWIAFLDSDDLWTPDKLEKQLKFMVENGYKFSYTKYIEIDEFGKEKGICISGPKHITRRGMYNFCWPGCLTVMYNRDAIGLIQIADIKKNNDYAMWLKVCKKADCYLLTEVLAKYRRGRSGSISTQGYSTLIKWHYKLFHEANKKNTILSIWLTTWNLIFGLYKKLIYVKKY